MVEKKSTTKSVEKPAKKPSKVKEEKTTQKSKKGWIAGLITVAILAVIGAIVAVFCSNKPDVSDPMAKLTYSPAFFIYDEGKYTLWNKDGKRLTEDTYDSQSNFVGGYAMVKKDDQYGLIRDDGKMVVEFGKYGNISQKDGLYLAQDGNTKEYYLLNNSGKELEKGSDIKVYTLGSTNGFAAVKVDNKIKLYNYAGKLVAEMEVIEGTEGPAMSSLKDFGLLHYGDQNILFDARNGEIVAKFEGPRFAFNAVTDDRGVILLEDYDKNEKYKLIKDGKVYDLDETKYYGITDSGAVVGYDNYSELALLDENYKVAKRTSIYVELKDVNNYAVENEEGDNVEIYYNGEKVKTFGEGSSVAASGVLYEDLYAVEDGGKYMFYNLDGSVGINHEFADIDTLFDKFHHAVVADEEGIYYLIDAKGNKIDETTAKSITLYKNGYALKNNDNKYAIAGKDGKPVTEFKYNDTYYRSGAEPHNVWTGKTGDDSYDVIDVETGKAILEGVNVDSFSANYFTVKNADGNTDYYTYSGELFYTKEKN